MNANHNIQKNLFGKTVVKTNLFHLRPKEYTIYIEFEGGHSLSLTGSRIIPPDFEKFAEHLHEIPGFKLEGYILDKSTKGIYYSFENKYILLESFQDYDLFREQGCYEEEQVILGDKYVYRSEQCR